MYKTYAFVYLSSVLLALLVTPLVVRLGHTLNLVDRPGVRKVHSKPVPRIGGVAIFVPTLCIVAGALFVRNMAGWHLRSVGLEITVLLIASGFIFLVGLLDDIRGLRVRVKLAAQLLAALTVCWAGVRVDSVTVTESLVVHLGWFSWPFTLLWIVGICNAVNFIDGLDGLAAGICAAACGVIVIQSFTFGSVVMAILMLALLGGLTGFLAFNFSPAKIFMGDSGSLFLGFTIAASSVLCAAKTEALVGLALPFLALGVPIFDTLFSMLRRFVQRRSIFSPDRSHFHHRLLALGLRQRHAVLVVYLMTLLTAGLGMFMLVTRDTQASVVFVCVIVLLVLVFRAVGVVRLHDTAAGLRRKYLMSQQRKREIQDFERIELQFREVRAFDEWWQAVCFAASEMDLAKGCLPVTNRDGTTRLLTWNGDGRDSHGSDMITVTIPICDRRAGSPLSLELQAHANGSLESAGRRVTLLTRLLEQYSVASLERRPRKVEEQVGADEPAGVFCVPTDARAGVVSKAVVRPMSIVHQPGATAAIRTRSI